jgi:N-methylhydantoinase A
MRYVGQGFEIVVPLPAGPFGDAEREALRTAFDRAYLDAYARLIPGAPVETLTWRLTALGPAPRAAFLTTPSTAAATGDARKGERPVWFPEFEEYRPVAVYDRYRLAPGTSVAGPAIVEERESTVVIAPGSAARVDASGSLVIDLG